MIRMKICLEDREWYDNRGAYYQYDTINTVIWFYCNSDYRLDDTPQPPFRDKDSLQFLETFGLGFVEKDWFSVIENHRRVPIVAMSPDLCYALCLIEFSKMDIYTNFFWCRRKVWKALNDLPFDILIRVHRSSIVSGYFERDLNTGQECDGRLRDESEDENPDEDRIAAYDLTGGVDYQIVNYPFGDTTVEVTVKKEIPESDPFYLPVAGQRDCGLCLGRDGKYYTTGRALREALRYFWPDDLEKLADTLSSIGKDGDGVVRLARITKYYTVDEFVRILDGETVRTAGRPEKNVFQITSHLMHAPRRLDEECLSLMILDRNQDGTFCIHGEVSGPAPSWKTLLPYIISMRSPDRDSMILVVRAGRYWDSRDDIYRTLCGFRVSKNTVEIFERKEASRLFAEELKEALASSGFLVENVIDILTK